MGKVGKQQLTTDVINSLNLYDSVGGVGATKTINIPSIESYTESTRFSFKMNSPGLNDGTPITINVNGLGAKPILKSNGSAFTTSNAKLGSVYSVIYNGTSFILQGEGGEYGTATAPDVLAGKTIGTETGIVTGTMTNRGKVETTLTQQYQQAGIAKGYHDGTGYVKTDFANLTPGNIKAGVNIGGVTGTSGIQKFVGSVTTSTNSGTNRDGYFSFTIPNVPFKPNGILANFSVSQVTGYNEYLSHSASGNMLHGSIAHAGTAQNRIVVSAYDNRQYQSFTELQNVSYSTNTCSGTLRIFLDGANTISSGSTITFNFILVG